MQRSRLRSQTRHAVGVSVVIGSVAGLEISSLVPVIVFSSIIPRDQPKTSRPGIDKLDLALQARAMIAIVLGILLIGGYGLLTAKKPWSSQAST